MLQAQLSALLTGVWGGAGVNERIKAVLVRVGVFHYMLSGKLKIFLCCSFRPPDLKFSIAHR